MPFIGNQPALSYTSFAKQDFTTSATTSYTLDNPVANANELALFINFVRQEPTTAYSASGTSLTLTSATSASDDMYCVYLGKAVQTVNPPNASVGASQIVDASITSGKLASGVLPTNTPAFKAYLSANSDTLNHDTMTVVPFNAEKFDTNSKFDTSTYRFTPGEIGYYSLTGTVCIDWISGASYLRQVNVVIQKNGSPIAETIITNFNSPDMEVMAINTNVIDYSSDVTDYYQLLAYQNNGSGNNSRRMRGSAAGERTFFCGQKIIT